MIGSRLRQLRNKHNLTLNNLSKSIGTTSMTLSRYENNQRQPDNQMLKKLADYFEVSIDYLLERTDIPVLKNYDVDTVNIPVYKEFGIKDISIPTSAFEIIARSYDFILDLSELIGFQILDNRYIPYFLPGDLLIIELTQIVSPYSPFYLSVLNSTNYILQHVGDSKHHVFTHANLEEKPIINDPKIIGRVISLHRYL